MEALPRVRVSTMHPGHSGGSRCDEGVDKGKRGIGIGFEVGAGVEAEPADPEQRGADHGQRHRVRSHDFLLIARALAEHDGADEARNTGIDVNDRAAGEVDCAIGEDQAGRRSVGARTAPEPDHVCHREVDEGNPEHDEEHDGRELDAFGECADDQAGRDAGEGHLEHDEGVFRNGDALREGLGERRRVNAGQERLGEAADEAVQRAAVGEGERIAIGHPDQRHDGRDHEDLHQHREHVLGADETAVEKRKAGDGHQKDERRRDEHPGIVTLVHGESRSSSSGGGSWRSLLRESDGRRQKGGRSCAKPRKGGRKLRN
ncbi:hypothetical protein ACVIKP_004210 [Rhizobium leguminosarum]